MAFTYACSDYPGMPACAGKFTAETKNELWEHIELHALVTHDEDPSEWPDNERAKIEALITTA
jgi:hypothetical protein